MIIEHSAAMTGSNNPMFGLKGEDNPNYGRNHTQEAIQKMSDCQKGENNNQYDKPLTEEHKAKISKSMSGENHHQWNIPLTEEHKRNLSLAKSGEKSPEFGKPPWMNHYTIHCGYQINWYHLGDIYDIWIANDKPGYIRLFKFTSKEYPYLKDSTTVFGNMIKWFKTYGNPRDNQQWMDFNNSFNVLV